MIAKLIYTCINNRALVLLLTGFLVVAGIWSAKNITVDAIPDLSDVQVVIRTEYPGQAPQIVEDQVTYPLTTAMLAVPYAKVVRGYSMFGSSFVYIIFDDGTDLYWARSRVLEQLSFVASSLPKNVSPQLGPDATGVGWVYQYILTTGRYCPDHPNGGWYDEPTDKWYESISKVSGQTLEDEALRDRLVHYRVFPREKTVYYDSQENKRYDNLEDIPAVARDRVHPLQLVKGYERCPLGGGPLVEPDIDLSDLRGLQDWYLRYELTAVEGVSEVAPVGGFVKQYQVVVDPVKLLAYNLPLQKIKKAIQRSNIDVGGRLIEMSETEYMVRGLGYLGSLNENDIAQAKKSGQSLENLRTDKVVKELRQVALGATTEGSPIYLSDVATIRVGPEIRRGIAEWNGEGEVVGGTVVMRFGENAKTTIERVKTKLNELAVGLPPGVALEVAYDRSDLIERAVGTVKGTLIEEIMVVSLVIFLFLLHARSSLVAACVLPVGVLTTLTVMNGMGINANIMSLGGIAISIGVMVDSSIVMVENAHKHLEAYEVRHGHEPNGVDRANVLAEAATEVGPTLFFSLLIITVSFLPIFVLGGQSGRLFGPLAYTKTCAMGVAAILAITLIPVLMVYFIRARMLPAEWSRRKSAIVYLLILGVPALILALIPMVRFEGYRWTMVIGWVVGAGLLVLPQKIYSEEKNPISILLQRIYNPAFIFVMQYKFLTIVAAIILMAVTWIPFSQLGSEFMPPLEEGDLLYMPTTDPGISMTKARELLQQTDKLIKQFPEVQSVFGKAGRFDTATDPAPPSMLETSITLHRDKSLWRRKPVERFYDNWPQWSAKWLRKIWPQTATITIDELIYGYTWGGNTMPGLNDVVRAPGLTNAWTMPIKTRIDMLSTGIKTPVGIKLMGPDLKILAEMAQQVSNALLTNSKTAPFTTSAFPEKSVGGNYFDIRIKRDQIARYNLSVADVQEVIMSAMGGMNVSFTIEGLERYPINLRYPHELRDNVDALKQTIVSTPAGLQVPISQLVDFEIRKGPPMIKSENARLTSWIYVDIAGIDVGTYVRNAQEAVSNNVKLPSGYSIVWSGQYEYMQAARKRLQVMIPLAGVLILLLLYMATKSWLKVCLVLLAVPFSLIGAVWLVYLLDYNLSLAVWVGVIALAGLDAETGLVMLLYLENSFDKFKKEGRMKNSSDLWHAVHDGAVQRIRPKTMTVVTTFLGLFPLLWASGAGADTMRRLAAPMIGGLGTSFIMELLLYPILFYLAKRVSLRSQRTS